MNTALGRTETALLTNKSGGSVAQGDVVIVDTANASAFTTTTSSAYVSGRIGVILEPNGIANNAVGLVAFGGYVPVINLSGTGSIGDLIKTHTAAKQGVRHAAPQVAGDFAQALGTTATPAALLFGTVQLGGGTGITMDQADPYGIHHRLSGTSADDDEFSTDTSAGYTAIAPTGSVTWAVANHVVSAVASGQSANDMCGFLKAMTLADGEAFETFLRIVSGGANYSMAGIVITDGVIATSNAIAVLAYVGAYAGSLAGTGLSLQLWKGTLTNLATNINSQVLPGGITLPGIRIRLKRTSSTSFNWLISTPDGSQWNVLGTTGGDPGFTPTHAGLCVSNWGGGHTVMASFDYIRHV